MGTDLAPPQPLVALVLAAEDSALDAEPEEGKAGQLAAVKRALDEAGLEIPFPYRTLTFHEPLETVLRRHQGRILCASRC